jgi:MtN3 and saliva related transmembrane protein
MTVNFEWNTTDLIGYAGGFILAFALLPQVIRTYRTKSTSDLSYMWQAMYLTGLSLSYIYLVLIEATAGWVTLTFELTMAIFLLVMKLKNDGCRRRPSDIAQETQGIKHVDESITELDDEETGRDEEDEIVVSSKNGWSETFACESSCAFAANYGAGLPPTFAAAFQTELQRLATANGIALHSCHVDTLSNPSGTTVHCSRDVCVSAWMERHFHLVAVYNDEHEELSVRLHYTSGGAAKEAQALYRSLTRDVVRFLQQQVAVEADVAE